MKKELEVLCGYAARKSPVAVMNSVRVTETFGYATDGPSSMRCTWQGPRGMDVCIDAGMLQTQLSSLPDDQAIRLEQGDGHVLLIAGRRRLKLRTVPPAGMPEIEMTGQKLARLDGQDMEHALRFALDATGNGMPRPEMANVMVEIADDGVWVVGLDGYRMHAWKVDTPLPAERQTSLIPKQLAKTLIDLCKKGGDLSLSRDRAVVHLKEMRYTCCLASAVFPPWRTVMPKQEKVKAEFKAGSKLLGWAMNSARQMGLSFTELAIKPSGEVVISGSQNGDEFEQTLEIDYAGSAMSINVNPALVTSAMPHMDEMATFAICAAGAGQALVVKSFEATALIQGMRG